MLWPTSLRNRELFLNRLIGLDELLRPNLRMLMNKSMSSLLKPALWLLLRESWRENFKLFT
jgi:hypothetical protein